MGATAVGNANTASVTFTGTTYNANAQTYTATAGNNLKVNGGATTFTSTNDPIRFAKVNRVQSGALKMLVNSAGGAISANKIEGTTSEDVTLNATTGTVAVGAIGTVVNKINTVVLPGAGGVAVKGNVTPVANTGDSVTVTGPAILGTNVTV